MWAISSVLTFSAVAFLSQPLFKHGLAHAITVLSLSLLCNVALVKYGVLGSRAASSNGGRESTHQVYPVLLRCFEVGFFALWVESIVAPRSPVGFAWSAETWCRVLWWLFCWNISMMAFGTFSALFGEVSRGHLRAVCGRVLPGWLVKGR